MIEIQENVTAKLFGGFAISQKTPEHNVFTNVRKRIGTNILSKLFEDMRNQLKEKGYMNEVFTFVDATHLISKANLWKERDKAIQEKYEKLNNEVLLKVAIDKQAKKDVSRYCFRTYSDPKTRLNLRYFKI